MKRLPPLEAAEEGWASCRKYEHKLRWPRGPAGDASTSISNPRMPHPSRERPNQEKAPDERPGEMTACRRPLPMARVPFLTLLVIVWMMVPVASLAQAQRAPTSSEREQEKLERDFTDPLSTLPQIIFRDSYSPATYGTNVQTNQAIIRPIIPRIPSSSLLPFVQLIRPTFALVTVPSSRGGSRTEFGDLPLFDVGVLPWPDRKKTGLLMALGPAFVFPTATSKSAGQGAWQAGPAFGAIYAGVPGLLVRLHCTEPDFLRLHIT